ncbi:phosphotransferase family protein [Arthrobacter sp. A5]|uniref:phosphotransferase family protein n=1 Tax=Arthrobacter sp. A5 TaxID=576926 RepID=UPI003DA8D58C
MTDPAGLRPVRTEDAFDLAAVARWLRHHAAEQEGFDPADFDGVPEVRQFSGGASNLTYLLSYPQLQVVLRRPPAGSKARSAHDMHREFYLQRQLKPLFGYVPAMIAFCADRSVLGSEFYVMERLNGTILRADPPAGFELGPDRARALCMELLDRLVELHSVDPDAAGLSGIGKGAGYVGRQVVGWSQRYVRARTENVGGFETVMAWLAVNQPADVRSCVIHNDFRLDNVVLAQEAVAPLRVAGVLDWEMATIGDPLMDLGGALAYWVQADDDAVFRSFRRQPTQLPGMLTRAEVVNYYTSRTRLALSPAGWTFYEVFGLFRLAVIAQQIYFRYFHRQTANEAFSKLHLAVRYLEERCGLLIGSHGVG